MKKSYFYEIVSAAIFIIIVVCGLVINELIKFYE